MILQITMLMLCGGGLYASAFILRKTLRVAKQGGTPEPSVVQTPRARVAGGVPNAALGLIYYIAVAAATPFLHLTAVWWPAAVAAFGAAAFSVYLGYSLLFVTKMPCIYCWSSHVANWLLLSLILAQRPQA